ncbi:MAG: Ig-like domain-containing protein [Bacillota bacterium]|nr:Ig-like domain-containing protein [Bacillota bacterium]
MKKSYLKHFKILTLVSLVILAMCFPLFSSNAASVLTKTSYYFGDVNLDASVTIKDATTIQKYLAKMTSLTGLQQFVADVNDDGVVTIKDVTVIQKWLAKIPVSSRIGAPFTAPTGITVIPMQTSVLVGDHITLTATVTPTNATNKTVTWSSSDTSIATVDETGVVTGVNSGIAVITARTINGLTSTSTVTVNPIITDDYGNTFSNASNWVLTPGVANTKSGTLEVPSDVDMFRFIASTTGSYTIASTSTINMKSWLYNSAQTQIAVDDDSGNYYNFNIVCNLIANQVYYLKVCNPMMVSSGTYLINIVGSDVSNSTLSLVHKTGQNDSFGTITGAGSYAPGTSVFVQATAKAGYGFIGWATDVSGSTFESYANPYNCSVYGDKTLFPVFISDTDSVTLVDPKVKDAVAGLLGNSATYTYTQLKTITCLSINGSSTLCDLVYFPLLTYLNTGYDVQNTTSQNTSYLAGLVNLNNLFLNNFPVDSLPLDNYTSLKSISMRFIGDNLSVLTKVKNTLESIDLYSSTSINDYSFLAQLTKLNHIYIAEPLNLPPNTLSYIPTSVTELSIERANIHDISALSRLTNLQVLDLNRNCITDISPLSNLTSLTNLGLERNRISDFSPIAYMLKGQMKYINFAFNPIANYSFFQNATSNCGDITADQMRQTIATAQDMVANAIKPGMTDIQKYQALAAALMNKTTYDFTYSPMSGYAYGALVLGASVCNGYTDAYQMLCNIAGMPCFEANSDVIGHTWNIVKVGAYYYNVDVTAMDGAYESDKLDPLYGVNIHFLKSDAFFNTFRPAPNQYNFYGIVCSDTSKDSDPFNWVGIL